MTALLCLVRWFVFLYSIHSILSNICLMFWLEDMLKALKEKHKEPEQKEPEPEPTTEVLFLCSYEGCGKTFFDAGALRKHFHIHGEKQHTCHWEGCGRVTCHYIYPCSDAVSLQLELDSIINHSITNSPYTKHSSMVISIKAQPDITRMHYFPNCYACV